MNTVATVLVAAACLFVVGFAKDIKTFKDCGSSDSSKGVITKLTVEPCESEPCKLKRGTDVNLKVEFTPKIGATSLKGVVFGILSGIPAPFPLPNPDGCRTVGCPIVAGQSYKYEETLTVEKFYPKVSLTVKWQLVDEKKNEIWCFTMPASVVD